MSFSPEWDSIYRAGQHMSQWPWSDMVSFVMRHARPPAELANEFRVLELGCGAGANIPFFRSLGVDYWGIEGSQHIVDQLLERFPELKGRLVVGDFTESLPFHGPFDLIVDRAGMTCNSTAAIARTLGYVRSLLKPGGRFIGIDWYSTLHDAFQQGQPAEDAYTRTNLADGGLAQTGRVHFADQAHLEELFQDFQLAHLEHKVIDRLLPQPERFAAWNLVAVNTLSG